MRGQQRPQAVVLVLVDDTNREPPVRLALERVEQPPELLDAAHRRDDEVERRELPGTRRRLRDARADRPARVRARRRPRR